MYPNPSESKKSKIDVPLKEKPVSDLRTVRMVDYSDDEDPTRRVVFCSEDELSKVSAEGSGPSPPTPELDSAMGVWRRIDLSNEINCDRDKSSQGLIASKSKSLTEGSGSAPATLELDSTMGVGSQIDLPREGSVEIAYRKLKEVIDEPSSFGNKKEKSKPDFKAVSRGMRAGAKKIAKTRIRDTRVYSYDELIEHRHRMEEDDDDSFQFSIDDVEKEFS